MAGLKEQQRHVLRCCCSPNNPLQFVPSYPFFGYISRYGKPSPPAARELRPSYLSVVHYLYPISPLNLEQSSNTSRAVQLRRGQKSGKSRPRDMGQKLSSLISDSHSVSHLDLIPLPLNYISSTKTFFWPRRSRSEKVLSRLCDVDHTQVPKGDRKSCSWTRQVCRWNQEKIPQGCFYQFCNPATSLLRTFCLHLWVHIPGELFEEHVNLFSGPPRGLCLPEHGIGKISASSS